jgi:hypothetical protein
MSSLATIAFTTLKYAFTVLNWFSSDNFADFVKTIYIILLYLFLGVFSLTNHIVSQLICGRYYTRDKKIIAFVQFKTSLNNLHWPEEGYSTSSKA